MNWLKYRFLYFTISLLVILPGLYSLARFGLHPSIEFTGGSLLELKLESAREELIREVTQNYTLHSLSFTGNIATLKLNPITQSQADEILNKLNERTSAEIVTFTSIGPSVGRDLLTKALTAVSIAALMTLLYIAYTFKSFLYGFSAVIAMLHDSLILLGTYSLLGNFLDLKADLLFVTAVLTTLSFSVHDTIVVFDRIRELHRKSTQSPFQYLANQAITETMVRSVNNSLTIIFMLLALVLLGGSSLQSFAIALLIGAVTGTYSSPFTAVPVLVTCQKLFKKV